MSIPFDSSICSVTSKIDTLFICACSEFVSICNTALQINGRMICADQREYQFALQDNYNKLCSALSDLLDESFLPGGADGTGGGRSGAHRQSMALFSAISGAPNNSSSA